MIVQSLMQTLGDFAQVEIRFHDHCLDKLSSLLDNYLGRYHFYVLFPGFKETTDEVFRIVDRFPQDKLLLIGNHLREDDSSYSGVFEEHALDIYCALEALLPVLRPYRRLQLIFPDQSYYPSGIVEGFKKFGNNFGFRHVVTSHVSKKLINEQDAVLVIEEEQLVAFIKLCQHQRWVLGQDIGVISYNDTSQKALIQQGITVISTDFVAMGKQIAEMILGERRGQIHNRFYIIHRSSL